MKVNSQVFRAYDIRGIVNEELSDELVKKLGKAIGTLLIRNNSDALNVCRDGRLSGPHTVSYTHLTLPTKVRV